VRERRAPSYTQLKREEPHSSGRLKATTTRARACISKPKGLHRGDKCLMEPLLVCSAVGFGFLLTIFIISCLFQCATTNSAKKKLLVICQLQIAAVLLRILSHLIQFDCIYHIISTRFLNSCLALGLVEPVARLYVVSKGITRLSGDIKEPTKKPIPPLPLYIVGWSAIILFWTDAIITLITGHKYSFF